MTDKLPPKKKRESGKVYAHRLMMHAAHQARKQHREDLITLIEKHIRKGSYLHARVLQTVLSMS